MKNKGEEMILCVAKRGKKKNESNSWRQEKGQRMNKTTELETLLTGCINCGTECEVTSSKDFLNWLLEHWENGEIPFYECPECREELEGEC